MLASIDVLGPGNNYSIRVSSVLNRNTKDFGKKHLADGREDTCWNSEQGSPQWIEIKFEEPRRVAAVRLMFQGGFAGKNCALEASKSGGGGGDAFKHCLSFHPDDSNKLQTFAVNAPAEGRTFRIVFADSMDFFGRVTVYQLQLISKDNN